MTSMAEGYARALLMTAQQLDCLETLYAQFGPVCDGIIENKNYYISPAVPVARQAAALRDALDGRICTLLMEFLTLLARRRHLRKLSEIRRHFEPPAQRALGLVTVCLRIPYAPDTALLEKLRAHLTHRGLIPQDLAAQATFRIIQDKALLGGFIAEWDGWQLDASVRSRLVALRRAAL